MRCTLAAIACAVSLSTSAGAIVGDAQPAESPIIRPAVMIWSSRGGCSGAVLGQALLLTAAHCVNAATQIIVCGARNRMDRREDRRATSAIQSR